jgi:CRP/FNR family cyclic AMP-dependent transcriptional regulator
MNQLLKVVDIFNDLSEEQVTRITGLCSELVFNKGELILAEGAYSQDLYIIVQGEVDILIDPSLIGSPEIGEVAPVTIAKLQRGQSFGEIALVDRGMRSASVRASQDWTHVLVIAANQLTELCDEDTHLGYRLMRNLAADLAMKVRNADLRLREKILIQYGLL